MLFISSPGTENKDSISEEEMVCRRAGSITNMWTDREQGKEGQRSGRGGTSG
jgi:hypothetical protein